MSSSGKKPTGSSVLANKPWSIDLTLREQDVGYDALQRSVPPVGSKKLASFEKQVESELARSDGYGTIIAGGSLSAPSPSAPPPSSSGASASSSSAAAAADKKTQALIARKKSRAMSIATSPGKQILMNGFMMYMSGRNLNIFSISITSMALFNPIKGLVTMNATFRSLEDPDGRVDLQLERFIFVALNLIWFGVGLYKMGSMRLLPTTSADWSGAVVWKEMMEISSVPPV